MIETHWSFFQMVQLIIVKQLLGYWLGDEQGQVMSWDNVDPTNWRMCASRRMCESTTCGSLTAYGPKEHGQHCFRQSSVRLFDSKWPPIYRRYFQMYFHQWTFLYFGSNFTEVCSWESNWQWFSIGSVHDFGLTRRQAITWTNADPVHWRIYAALGEMR